MKNVFHFALLSLLVAAAGCTKMASSPGSGSSASTTNLTASVTNAAKGQPVTITVPSSVTSGIRWSVSPANNATTITPGNGSAVVYFGAAGKYTIYAGYASGADSTADTCTVTVGDTAYTPPPPPPSLSYDTLSLAHDSIFLTPVVDSNGSLYFIAKTAGSYGGFPTLMYGVTSGPTWASGINLWFSAIVSDPSSGTANQAVAYIYLPGLLAPTASDYGTYPIDVQKAGVVFNGDFTISAGSFSFYWPNTTQIIITPTVVSR
ncbi:MAG TPA: hypothetical protein VL547_08485 [Dinghuibacter sp.]|jgi:hypothetical protein|uniref:hypothetical protein n=1 Tax=Dinghuibacter sp. TaxID=2024697 RepID=UPI002B94D70A|nr:hypothetical protein [Dinghuibacter sp.]HTJ12048.1 hypothetical protein [Dinghuibacter sp.]